MSNQSTDGFQGSQPFISDKEYNSFIFGSIKIYIKPEETST